MLVISTVAGAQTAAGLTIVNNGNGLTVTTTLAVVVFEQKSVTVTV